MSLEFAVQESPHVLRASCRNFFCVLRSSLGQSRQCDCRHLVLLLILLSSDDAAVLQLLRTYLVLVYLAVPLLRENVGLNCAEVLSLLVLSGQLLKRLDYRAPLFRELAHSSALLHGD